MTAAPTAPARLRAALPLALVAAFAGSVAIRVVLAGPAGARAVPAALAFAALLLALTALHPPRRGAAGRALLLGVGGVAVLVAPVALTRGVPAVHPAGSYATWALLTVVVAGAEEAFLRGALFDAVQRWRSADLAVVVTAIAFALLHLPFYGASAMPLDLAVGVALGALRLAAGSWLAPAIAHAGADLVGWWLV